MGINMSLSKFKDDLINPLKMTIDQYKDAKLSQFKSLDDVKVQWSRAEGMEMCLTHIESTYAKFPKELEPIQEVLPPE
jgi:hypothetical protein